MSEGAGGIDVELDADKRTSRGILLGHKLERYRDIAKFWGTFLRRDDLTDTGKHSSDTCLLAFAKDLRKDDTPLALKLMHNREEWLREQQMRKLPDGTSLDGRHVVQLLEATEPLAQRQAEAARKLETKLSAERKQLARLAKKAAASGWATVQAVMRGSCERDLVHTRLLSR